MILKPHTEIQFKIYSFSFHKEDGSDIKALPSDHCSIILIVEI